MLLNAGYFQLNYKKQNWQNVILLGLMTFYLTNFGYRVVTEKFTHYTQDFLAYWSVAKIADVTSYSQVFDLDHLRSVETEEMIKFGLLDRKNDSNFSPIPASYLSVFIILFQIISRIEMQASATILLIINFMMMIGSIFYFKRDTVQGGGQGWGTFSSRPLFLTISWKGSSTFS